MLCKIPLKRKISHFYPKSRWKPALEIITHRAHSFSERLNDPIQIKTYYSYTYIHYRSYSLAFCFHNEMKSSKCSECTKPTGIWFKAHSGLCFSPFTVTYKSTVSKGNIFLDLYRKRGCHFGLVFFPPNLAFINFISRMKSDFHVAGYLTSGALDLQVVPQAKTRSLSFITLSCSALNSRLSWMKWV